MGSGLFDAHNHLQDERFEGQQATLVAACRAAGVAGMVVNGSCEEDWPAVLRLAREYPGWAVPSFGLHPWYVRERTPRWEERLKECLDGGSAAIGEIGLDRWKPGLPYDGQEEVFRRQMELAAARNLPVSIHCLQTWGRLLELLQSGPRPACGFLLHSYGGPRELVRPLAEMGGYFGLPGYFAHERKSRQRETFRWVPRDRLLIETDAPDQSLPAAWSRYSLGSDTKPLNHPANLGAVYAFASELLGEDPDALALRVEQNFEALFGGLLSR